MARIKRAITLVISAHYQCSYFQCHARIKSGHDIVRAGSVRRWKRQASAQRGLDALRMLFQDFKISHGAGMKLHVNTFGARNDVGVDVKYRLACG